MAVVEVRDQRVFFDDVGSGMPVVLGHSFLCSRDMWRNQIHAFEQHYRMINVDLRGHGKSGPAHQRFSLYDAVKDVVAVLDELGVEKAVWCGLSIGGMVALRAAVTVPDRVSALVLMDTDAGSEHLLRKLKYRLMGVGARALGMRPFLPAITRLMFGATTRRNNPGLVDEWRDVFADVDLPSALQCLACLMDRDSVVSRLPEISVPSLVIVGQEDRSLPVTLSHRIHQGLPDSEIRVIPEAGHLTALEQPSQVNDALEAFLPRVSNSAAPA